MLLRKMRNGFFSAIFLGLLVAGAFGLMLSDWNGFFRNGNTKTDVAKVDGVPIKIATFNSKVTKVLRSQQLDPAKAYEAGVIDNILQGEILQIILKKTTAEYGIRVDDAHVAEQVRDIITPLKGENGTDKEALEKFLQMQGLSERQLVEILRDETATNVLKSVIGGASYLPAPLMNDVAAYRDETRSVDYIFIPNERFKGTKTTDEAALKSYYETIKSVYTQPEHRNATIAFLEPQSLIKPIEISDADVKARYDEDASKYALPETRSMEQSILADQKMADAVIKAVKSGTSLKDASKTISKSDKNYQSIKDYAEADLPTTVAKILFAAKDGDVLGPIETPLGWHVIHLHKVTPPHTQPLETVSAKIREELQAEKSSDQLYDITSQIEDRLASGNKYEDMAKEYNLKVVTLHDITASTKDMKDFDFSESSEASIIAKIMAAAENEPSSLSEVSPKVLYSLRVDKVTPAAPKDFANVKDDVAKRWAEDQAAQANLISAQALVADINNGKAKLESQKDKLEHIDNLSLQTNEKSPLPREIAYRFMDAAKGKIILAVSNSKQGIYIGHVKDIRLGSAPASDDMKQKMTAEAANANLELFVNGLQHQYPVQINHELITRTYGNNKSSSDQ